MLSGGAGLGIGEAIARVKPNQLRVWTLGMTGSPYQCPAVPSPLPAEPSPRPCRTSSRLQPGTLSGNPTMLLGTAQNSESQFFFHMKNDYVPLKIIAKTKQKCMWAPRTVSGKIREKSLLLATLGKCI